MFIFGFFLYPISEHSFTLKALKKLYLAKSKDPLLMKSKKKKNLKTGDAKNDKTEAQKVVDAAEETKDNPQKPKNIILSTR